MTDIKNSYNMDCSGNCYNDKPKALYLYVAEIPLVGDDVDAWTSLYNRMQIQQGGYLPFLVTRTWDMYFGTPYTEPQLSYHEKGQPVVEVFVPLDVDFSTIPWQNVAS